jgi:hypothetical protein
VNRADESIGDAWYMDMGMSVRDDILKRLTWRPSGKQDDIKLKDLVTEDKGEESQTVPAWPKNNRVGERER